MSSSQAESGRISNIHNHESSKTAQIHWNSSCSVPGNVPNGCGRRYKLNSRHRVWNAFFLRLTQNLQRGLLNKILRLVDFGMYWTLHAYLELPTCPTNCFQLPNEPTTLCEIQYQSDNKGKKRARSWSKFKIVEEQIFAEISRMQCQIKKSLSYSWTLSKKPCKKKSAGPRDQFSQKCKFTKSSNSIFAWNCDSKKFEIMHVRGNWSPGLLDFFCMVFYNNSTGFQQNFDRVTQDSDLAWYLLLDERYKEFSNHNATSVPTKSDCWTR